MTVCSTPQPPTSRPAINSLKCLKQLEIQMREAAKKFEFEKAAQLRDRIRSLRQKDLAGLIAIEQPTQAEQNG